MRSALPRARPPFTLREYNQAMAKELLEVERKYDVTQSALIPSLEGVVDGAVDGRASEHVLAAKYFDTEDLRLRAARVTLRHRTGGTDAGWHLKLPADGGRLEVHSASAAPPAEVPEELLRLVRAVVRRRPLAPVAQLRTTRTVNPLLDASGRILLELVDDEVQGQAGDGEPLRWREWEAELVAGELPLLDSVEQRLLDAGASPAAAASKVARVLGKARPAIHRAALPNRPTAADVVRAHLSAQLAELVVRDPQVRRDSHDAVHKMRVATRRLRSALSTFRPLLDRDVTDPLRDELRWLAGVLGHARDAEVLHERIRALLVDEPAELVLGPVAAKVDEVLLGRYRRAHAAVLVELDGDRYLDLLDRLEELVATPPWQGRADRPAAKVLPRLVARADRRLMEAVRRADELEGVHAEEARHEARKDAKRLRYACEAVAPVFGQPATALAKAATALQEVLGEHQDSVVTRQVLRDLGAASSRSGQNGFAFGRLHGLEQARDEERADRWREVWSMASKDKLRRWLTT
jgi:CHAD domain-containing protein